MKIEDFNPKTRELIKRTIAAEDQARSLASRAIRKSSDQNVSMAENEGESPDSIRRFARIAIHSFRVRSLDDDNSFPKFFVDSLRYSGAIFDDSKTWAKIQYEEVIVDNPALERTEIEVEYGRS